MKNNNKQQNNKLKLKLQQALQYNKTSRTNAHDDYQKELDRLSKEKIAIIQATGFGNVASEDTNSNEVPDVLRNE